MRLKKYLAGLTLGLALAPFSAQALQEYSATDAVSFQAALDAAEIDMEDSRIVLAAGEYHTGDNGMLGEFIYNSAEGTSLEIQGAGVGQTILDGDGATRVLQLTDSSIQLLTTTDHVTVSGVSIVDGLDDGVQQGAGLLIFSLTGINRIEIQDSQFVNNRVQDEGGALAGAGGGASILANFNTLQLTNNTFEQNFASTGGGIATLPLRGILDLEVVPLITVSGLIDFQGNQFLGNQANIAGAADLTSLTSSLEKNNFEGNTAQIAVGGVTLFSFEEANLNSNRFVGNQALAGDVGGLWIPIARKASVTNAIVLKNSSQGNGGGIQYGFSPNPEAQSNTFYQDWLLSHTPSEGKNIDDWISADIAAGPGITLTHNTISGNTADVSGGGVAIFLRGVLGEGGLEVRPDTVDIYNNIIYGNDVNVGAGNDIYIDDFASIETTIAAATVNLFNNDYSDFFSECLTNADCAALNTVNEDEATNIDADPLLTDLENGDAHLRAGSPAIDRGDLDPPGYKTLDYDGVTRFYGTGPDMGALETTPAIEVTPLEYNFGNVEVGESKSTVITIKSIGVAILNVSSISLEDTNNFAFDVNAGSNPCGSTAPSLPSGESCTVGATFAPDVEGALDTFLTVDSNAVNDPSVPVHLLGNGVDNDGLLEGSGVYGLFCSLNAQAATSFSGILWMFAGLPLVAMLRKRRS